MIRFISAEYLQRNYGKISERLSQEEKGLNELTFGHKKETQIGLFFVFAQKV